MTTHFHTTHPLITVTDCSRAGHLVMGSTRTQIRALISISDPPPQEKRPPREAMARIPTLRLTFDDTERETSAPRGPYDTPANDEDPPKREDVEKALVFGRDHLDYPGRVLIHCFAGRARSTAVALGILAQHLGPGREAEAMTQLLRACERAPLPNMLIVRYADAILERNGALVRVAQRQNDDPEPAEAERDRPVTGTALLAAIRRGDL